MAKKPITFERPLQFGIEIEISDIQGSRSQVAEAIRAAGVPARAISGVEHYDYNTWKIEYDGSLNDCPNGMEIVSPVLKGVEGLRELELVLEVLNELGAKVNVKCGVHVHHYANDLTLNQLKNVYRLYAKHEQAIDEIFPPSRFNNNYAKMINGYFMEAFRYDAKFHGKTVLEVAELIEDIDEWKRVLGGGFGRGYYKNERYYKINSVAWVKHGTLEFRQHSGSTDYEKLSNWIIVTHKIIETACKKKVVRMKSASRLAKCNDEQTGHIHRNYDLYYELGLNATSVAEFIGKRQAEFRKRGIGKRGEYILSTAE